jgi:hypothetical protein
MVLFILACTKSALVGEIGVLQKAAEKRCCNWVYQGILPLKILVIEGYTKITSSICSRWPSPSAWV